MNLIDYVVLVFVALAVFAAVCVMIRQRRRGGCIGCSHATECASCSQVKKHKKKEGIG